MQAKVYTSGDELPSGLREGNFFHSAKLFHICRNTPRHRPYMVTLEEADGTVVAQMLAVVRYRSSWLPPYYYMHCRIMGEGCYAPAAPKPETESEEPETTVQAQHFGMMMTTLTKHLGSRMLYIELSHLSHKMFGYRQLRQLRYFPVKWMSIHNSLHSRTPEERIGKRLKKRIDSAYERGATTDEVHSEEEFKEFMQLLRHHNWLKPKRYIPHDDFFHQLYEQPECGRLFLTRYKGKVVGCSAVVYSNGQAYLWFAAYRRKSYVMVHPRELTIWHAIKDSHSSGYEHIFFMDVGLPFRKNKFRDFILLFGGKPVNTFRWFRFSIKWLNSLLSWIYRY